MNRILMHALSVRTLLLCVVLLVPVKILGAGFTPTDAGLVANLKRGDRFMISVWLDDNNNGVEDPGEEYFVCDYPSYKGEGTRFTYEAKNYVKLRPQAAGATEPSAASIWTVDTALTRTYALTAGCGINTSYTMWGNSGRTLICGDGGFKETSSNSNFKFLGYLYDKLNNPNLCDAIFVIPTVRPTGTESMDPNGTLEANHTLNNRTRGSGTDISPSWAFDGKKGIGFGGRAYREVYWFVIPRSNSPIAYTNAALVTFNTTNTTQNWSHRGNGVYDITCAPGMAAYAFADEKHKPTPRTVFRFYNLTEEIESCADSYFFAHDEQDYVRFRKGPDTNVKPNLSITDSTDARKIYTNDHLHCMERAGNSKYYKTNYFQMQFSDNTYYYIGKNNVYYAARNGVSLGSTAGAYSQFRQFSQMRITGLANAATAFRPSEGACGRIVVDTTSGAENLGATFEPAGYFLKVSTGKNIRLHPNADSTVWTCDEMWHITDAYAALKIKATTFTGPRFREDDPGADIDGWSEMVVGNTVPLITTGGSIVGVKGWARIYTDSVQKNGYMVFVPADTTKCLHYDNNGFLGVQIPNQYAEKDVTDEVEIREGRLKDGYIFNSWNTQADGLGTTYHPGDTVTLTEGTLTLYAQATYVGQYNVAISFLDSTTNKRYFLSHPGTAAPNRFAHARTYTDWTNVRQGLSNDMNDDPNHITTYELFEDTVTHLPEERLFVLTQETLRGYEDTLLLNEDYFSSEDYLGLYYQDPNVILANENWVGLFKSSGGWPDYEHPVIDSTILSSTHYNTIEEGVATRQERANELEPYVKYNPSNQFDGIAEEANATRFQLSTVVVADEHYIIQPDTTDAATGWTESITFGYHESPLASRQVWSKLLGKQLMAAMFVGDDTIYFHPNSKKLFETASQLRLSADFRLSQNFSYIRDARVESLGEAVAEDDKPSMTEASNEYCRIITSGQMSPMNVRYNGEYIDIVDTLRVSLNPGGISKIKDYYGWWRDEAVDSILPDGSRYRDILVTTKTYHYGPTLTAVQLKPAFEIYEFPPLEDHSRTIDFAVVRETSRQLLDAQGTVIRTEILNTDTVKNVLDLSSATYTLATDTLFSIGTKTGTSVTLTTLVENDLHDNRDTLTVTTQVTISGVVYDLVAHVPLMQTDLTGDYMIWSVVDGGTRYFVTAGSGGLQFRQYSGITNSRLLRNGQELIIGSANAANNNNQYLTPWASDYPPSANDQLRFWTEYGVNKRLVITGETVGLTDYNPNDNEVVPTYLTYVYVDLHSNENGNVEELVRLKYGADKWLKFNNGSPKRLELVNKESEGSVFSWTYLKSEYNLLNYGEYPDKDQEEFTYNSTRTGSIQTRYKAYKEYSILLDDQMVYVAKEADELDMADLIDAEKEWKTHYNITHVRDSRMATSSGLSISIDSATLVTTITQSGESPKNVMVNGEYVNIVDTLDVALSLQADAPSYHFKDKWSTFQSVDDAHLKIPLIRRTYHDVQFDSLLCLVDGDEYNHAFPNALRSGHSEDSLCTFTLSTERRQGTNTFNVYNEIAASRLDGATEDWTDYMDLTDINMASVRLLDDNGKAPSWCRIESKTDNSITVRCLSNGLRTPRTANIYIVYIIMIGDKMRFVDSHLTVSQASLFQYANNQHLVHSKGASGDTLKNGMQQTHENKQILYYYNPGNLGKANQEVELPVRERGFYGWWRWYREGKDQNGVDVGDTDVPDSVWTVPPRNAYNSYNFPFRVIGDSVKVPNPKYGQGDEPDSIKQLVTQGRYTVFYYPSKPYQKSDPPSKSPRVLPPFNKTTATYVVDISNYYDNLPLSMANVNQIDTAMMDTMTTITEPTLSLREIFELHPWTEMADTLEHYKTTVSGPFTNDKYLEDHVVMAPTGNRLLLKTEQRYRYDHLTPRYDDKGKLVSPGHSESLLGYYMKDDNWESMSSTPDENGVTRRDTMIWCGGWDTDCQWFTYNPKTDRYDTCRYNVTLDDDFLNVNAKGGIPAGQDYDTVYYCLRSRSKATTTAGTELDPDPDEPKDGNYWFNICRYKIIYHSPAKHGPKLEAKVKGVMKALITNDEIEQDYEVLERLDFDYNKPGADYTVYPHPLPWADCSYGYSYPVGPEIPDNRQHNDFAPNFPGPGEYSLINRIQKTNDVGPWYQRNIEQHGGKENGYMLYCDGMSKAGQVAALSLETNLCEGQKLYFSGFVGNSSSQTGKSNPNFTFSVQGSKDGGAWEDVTTYMTGDIMPSNNWYQIFFPILHNKNYDKFRVRIYNMASDFDGNDFIIDDMCIFATKPPLIAYQANTKCVEQNENDSIIHVVLRVDYQGFVGEGYNDADVHYTIEQITKESVHTFVPMIDHYINESIVSGTIDTIFGHIRMPLRNYEPTDPDSIFINLNRLAEKFEESVTAHEAWEASDKSTPEPDLFRKGYIKEYLDAHWRPVLYVVHKAKMAADNEYKVRMSLGSEGLMNSHCAMTSNLKVTNRMKLMLDGREQEEKEIADICGNVTYEVGMRVKGMLILDGTAPQEQNGSCVNDWLLYGDTSDITSVERYGYKYSDIVHVVKDILRYDPASGESNTNQFARTLGAVNRNVMQNIKTKLDITFTTPGHESDHPYDILANLVNNGFLMLYQSDLMISVPSGDSVQYVVFPILGTGSDKMHSLNMEVCPTPLVIKLKSKENKNGAPLVIGGLKRDSTQLSNPVVVLADASNYGVEGVKVPVDAIRNLIGVSTIQLQTTDDPNFRVGVDKLEMQPDKHWPGDAESYYHPGDTIIITPSSNNYNMLPGYNYTFAIEMVDLGGDPNGADGCPIGTVPFTLSVVPSHLRWNPQNAENNLWNNPENWIGINDKNDEIIHDYARYAPLPSTNVIIPAMEDGLPYPEIPSIIASKDSVKQTGFTYNTCAAIRFLPGAVIGKQQNLSYSKAIVDMSLPNQKWALCSAPVAGLLSGDFYMANADLGEKKPWEVGEFDAAGRNHNTGNASFYLSVYNRSTTNVGNGDNIKDTTYSAKADWSKVTNAMTLPLPQAQGFAVYARTKLDNSGNPIPANIRLPKTDDTYYYYTGSGDVATTVAPESNLRAKRDEAAGEGKKAGKLAYSAGTTSFTLTNGTADTLFVFGNPTMAYIDIWGFIADNSLVEQMGYLDAGGKYHTVTKASAEATTDTISNPQRYLPPMRAIMIRTTSATTELTLSLNANRVIIEKSQKVRASVPRRATTAARSKGIMTVTAVNSVSDRCTSQLLIGQGYNDDIRLGEDAMLTTLNIDKFHMTNTPTTPFNLYAWEGNYGLSIDLRDEVLNVPISFYNSNLPYDPVTYLWFTGVHNIDVPLVLYDALTDTERPIYDGICLDIETPEANHEKRYYIRHRGYNPDDNSGEVATDMEPTTNDDVQTAQKILHHGHVLILRNGHVYTMFGQKMR